MTAVTVVIPWHDADARRREILAWLEHRYAARHPDWQVVRGEMPNDGEWCKAEAIRDGLTRAAADTVVVADADIWCPGIPDAVDAVVCGHAWARPHRLVHRLTDPETDRVLAGAEPTVGMATVEKPYRGTGGGAFVVARRATLLDVPPDRRFRGWGAEDGAWRDALRTLAGMEWAGRAPAFHLHHPPQRRSSRHRTSDANAALAREYIAARRRPTSMRELVEAGR